MLTYHTAHKQEQGTPLTVVNVISEHICEGRKYKLLDVKYGNLPYLCLRLYNAQGKFIKHPDSLRPWMYFRILDIMAVDLETVKNLYFRLEGFDSPEDFEKTWRALHRGHFTTGKPYYMHVFGRVS